MELKIYEYRTLEQTFDKDSERLDKTIDTKVSQHQFKVHDGAERVATVKFTFESVRRKESLYGQSKTA